MCGDGYEGIENPFSGMVFNRPAQEIYRDVSRSSGDTHDRNAGFTVESVTSDVRTALCQKLVTF